MIQNADHLSTAELEAGLEHIRQSPRDDGVLALIVRRPKTNEREQLEAAELTHAEGLVGDNWSRSRGRRGEPPDPDTQLNIMNARAAALVAASKDRWALAGDQLYVDFDLSDENAPVGTRLEIGECIVEITQPPHTGCAKFSKRFGPDAKRFVNSPEGKRLHLRGVNARVERPGVVRIGDRVRKVAASAPAS